MTVVVQEISHVQPSALHFDPVHFVFASLSAADNRNKLQRII
jgi:hypothetical protein